MAAESSSAASTSRSGGGASPDTYIGSLISLTSKSEIRYEGILYNINTEESSIGLRNVRSFGTEGRKKDGPQVPPNDKIYEYILFRGSDIKDLQVKSSPPIPTAPTINSDPAIIQSHYPRPTAPPTSLPAALGGSLPDLGSHSAQVGLSGPPFQTGLPLYQQAGANLNSWGPSPPNANGSGLAMQMYWPGFYGAPNGLTQLPQHSLFRPPSGLSIPPPIQQMPYSGFNTSLPQPGSSFPSSSIPDYHSVPNTGSSSMVTSTSLPASTLSFNVPFVLPASLPSETIPNPLQNKVPISTIPTSLPNSTLQPLSHLSTSAPDSVGVPSVASKSNAPGPAVLPQQRVSQPVTFVDGLSASVTETPMPSLITPGQLLQPVSASSSSPTLPMAQKDVEVVQVSHTPSAESPAPSATEAQPPILPLPPNTQVHKMNGGSYHTRNNYRGRGGRGPGISRPLTKFTEDFDFKAMNEKFKKDEVWGHLGKSNKSLYKDKEGNESDSDQEDLRDDDDAELPKIEIKSVYNKDDFFDSLSCNALDNDPNHGRTRYSEQMKLDTETFGDFSRSRGGRGGRGPGRGGGRFRGSYYGRGYGGYGRGGRGRGHMSQNRA